MPYARQMSDERARLPPAGLLQQKPLHTFRNAAVFVSRVASDGTAEEELLVLAALVANGAGSLTCRLAGSLALAASALLHGFFQILGL